MENLKLKRNIIAFNGERYSVWKLRIRALLTEQFGNSQRNFISKVIK